MSGLAKLKKPSIYITEEGEESNKKSGLLGIKKNIADDRAKVEIGDNELTKIIDAMIVREEENELSKRGVRGGRFNPSSLGETCDRLLYLSYNGLLTPENNRDAANLRRLGNGHSLEARFFGYLLKLNIYRQQEKRIQITEPPMSGRIDFIIQLPEREHLSLLELKTINDRGFSSLKAPKPEHETQLQCYLNMNETPHGMVLYENKNDQNFKEFHVYRDLKKWKEIVDRCKRIQLMTEVPDIPKVGHSRYCGCRAWGK